MLLDGKNCSVQQKPPSVAQEQYEAYSVWSGCGSFYLRYVSLRTDTESSSHEAIDEVEWQYQSNDNATGPEQVLDLYPETCMVERRTMTPSV